MKASLEEVKTILLDAELDIDFLSERLCMPVDRIEFYSDRNIVAIICDPQECHSDINSVRDEIRRVVGRRVKSRIIFTIDEDDSQFNSYEDAREIARRKAECKCGELD